MRLDDSPGSRNCSVMKRGQTRITKLPGLVVSPARPDSHAGSRLPSMKTRCSSSDCGSSFILSSIPRGVSPRARTKSDRSPGNRGVGASPAQDQAHAGRSPGRIARTRRSECAERRPPVERAGGTTRAAECHAQPRAFRPSASATGVPSARRLQPELPMHGAASSAATREAGSQGDAPNAGRNDNAGANIATYSRQAPHEVRYDCLARGHHAMAQGLERR